MRAKIKDLIVGMDAGYVTLSIPKEEINRLAEMEGKELDATIKIHRESRSKDANAMMWACIGQIANALNTDKWEIYLKMLKRYGQFTHICVKPIAVDAIKRQWRECEIVGEVEINGKKAVQMLCYYGSSTYDSKEFSVLLDGIVGEMKEMGLQIPPNEEMQAALERWGK